MKNVLQWISLSLLFLLCTACSTLPSANAPLNQKLSWQTRQQQLQAITTWALSGQIAIQNQQQRQSANVTWLQKERNYTISVFGPLGLGGATLIGQADKVTLAQADGKKITASSPEALLAQSAQWVLPVSNLYFWIRGLPAPSIADKTNFDQYNHLRRLQQQGWVINYLRYTGVNGQDLPSEMTMARPPLKIKIVISQWKFPFKG